MNQTNYLQRAPLLDSRQHVLGYKLAWQNKEKNSGLSTGANLRQLLNPLATPPAKTESSLFFLDMGPAALPAEIRQALTPKNTVLMLNQADLVSADNISLIMSLQVLGFGLTLCDVDLALLESNDGLLSLMKYVEVGIDHPDLKKIANLAKLADPALTVVVRKILDWREFETCAALGLSGFFGNLCTMPRKSSPSGGLGPQTVLILQLMQMVQENADVRELEKVLKRDATILYNLLHYINSASFGIEVEIESLHHAVTMLGYSPLYRWLSLLLAKTSTTGFSPALLQAAIVRGRFMELLGQKLLSKSEAENLFVVGLFSLLDQLLGIPMEQVLRQISLSGAIAQALVAREGIYGPFLALAEACELENGCASDLADALFLSAAHVNQSHLSALVWAQNLKI